MNRVQLRRLVTFLIFVVNILSSTVSFSSAISTFGPNSFTYESQFCTKAEYSFAPKATQLLGQQFGKLGRIVKNPGLKIEGFAGSASPGHAINQIINRGVTPQMLQNTVQNPSVVLSQWQGARYLYLSSDAAVVMTRGGQVVTAWTKAEFTPKVLEVLKAVGVGP